MRTYANVTNNRLKNIRIIRVNLPVRQAGSCFSVMLLNNNNKSFFLSVLACILAGFVVKTTNAQSFQPAVIGSSGTYTAFSGGSMAWTIGEAITETFSPSGYFFTQGFHQPDTTYINAVSEINTEKISIYPNPVLDNLIIDFSSSSGNYTIEIFNTLGQVMTKEFVLGGLSGQKQIKISLHEFVCGVYLLNIVSEEANNKSSYKINKIK